MRKVGTAAVEMLLEKIDQGFDIASGWRKRRVVLGFGGATVDGVELPVWPQLLTSSARY